MELIYLNMTKPIDKCFLKMHLNSQDIVKNSVFRLMINYSFLFLLLISWIRNLELNQYIDIHQNFHTIKLLQFNCIFIANVKFYIFYDKI